MVPLVIFAFVALVEGQYYPNTQYGAQLFNNEPGYLPDYQGDKYTNQQRIAETQALNRPFFDWIGGAPPAPPKTPAQFGQLPSNPVISFNNQANPINPYSSGYNRSTYYPPSSNYNNQQYSPYNNGYYYGNSSRMPQYYNPNSDPPTRYYDPVLNTNLGYPNQVQPNPNQQYQYGIGSSDAGIQRGYDSKYSYNMQYGYYGPKNSKQQYQDGRLYSQQKGNAQSWCCGPTSTSCCYQVGTGSNSLFYDSNMHSNTYNNNQTPNNRQYGYSGTYGKYTAPSAYATTQSYGRK